MTEEQAVEGIEWATNEIIALRAKIASFEAAQSASNPPTTNGEAARIPTDTRANWRESMTEVTGALARLQSWLDEDGQNWGQREKDTATLIAAARIPATGEVERVLRAFADKHSACGEAWNLSSVLACVRSTIPIPTTGETVEQAYREGYCDGVGEPDSMNARYWWEQSCAREALSDHTTKDDE